MKILWSALLHRATIKSTKLSLSKDIKIVAKFKGLNEDTVCTNSIPFKSVTYKQTKTWNLFPSPGGMHIVWKNLCSGWKWSTLYTGKVFLTDMSSKGSMMVIFRGDQNSQNAFLKRKWQPQAYKITNTATIFGWPFVKRFALCYRTIVFPVCTPVLSVCNVGVFWPNGWMDQCETRHGGMPRPGHIVLDGEFWGPSFHSKAAQPPSNFRSMSAVANGRMDQEATW